MTKENNKEILKVISIESIMGKVSETLSKFRINSKEESQKEINTVIQKHLDVNPSEFSLVVTAPDNPGSGFIIRYPKATEYFVEFEIDLLDIHVIDEESTTLYMKGSIKWDGCTNFEYAQHDTMHHFCGPEKFILLNKAMELLWKHARRLNYEAQIKAGKKRPEYIRDWNNGPVNIQAKHAVIDANNIMRKFLTIKSDLLGTTHFQLVKTEDTVMINFMSPVSPASFYPLPKTVDAVTTRAEFIDFNKIVITSELPEDIHMNFKQVGPDVTITITSPDKFDPSTYHDIVNRERRIEMKCTFYID